MIPGFSTTSRGCPVISVACLLDLQLGWESIYLRTGISLLCNSPYNNKNNNEGM